MKTISTRRNRKQEYINGLNHDITLFRKMIASAQCWHWIHGERKPRTIIKRELEEMLTELRTVETDKTYKPWKTFDY